jgi:hypothetical protein
MTWKELATIAGIAALVVAVNNRWRLPLMAPGAPAKPPKSETKDDQDLKDDLTVGG